MYRIRIPLFDRFFLNSRILCIYVCMYVEVVLDIFNTNKIVIFKIVITYGKERIKTD